MNRFFYLFLSLFCITLLEAQAVTDSVRSPAHSRMGEYRWVFQVEVNPLHRLPDFTSPLDLSGIYLFARRNISPNRAWQFGVWGYPNLTSRLAKNVLNDKDFSNVATVTSGGGINAAIQYMLYMPINQKFRGVFGFGPMAGAGFWGKKKRNSGDPGEFLVESRMTRWDIGLLGTFTLEWFFNERLTVNAQVFTRWGMGVESQGWKKWEVGEGDTRVLSDQGGSHEIHIFVPDTVLLFGISFYITPDTFL